MGEKKKAAPADKRALYRKYRSKNLDEVVGQEHITKTLKNALESGKISHAYLFTGPRGVGKTSIARILAHEVNKLPYDDDKIHLDIIEIDAASNRRIDDIRDLREKVNLAPVSGEYKVYIIDEVHMLTTESFNALLKTLEEPPAHVIFILATTEVHKLPATIISRTQRHTFKAVPTDKVAGHLQYISKNEGIDIEDTALELLAKHGDGSFRDSISLLDQASHLPQPITIQTIEDLLGLPQESALDNILRLVASGDTNELVKALESLNSQGFSSSTLANQLVQRLRQQTPTMASNSLVKELLAVGSALQPNLQLEVILLESCLNNSTDVTDPVKQAATVKPEPKKEQEQPGAKKKPEAEAEAQKTETNNKVEIHSDLDQAWPEILASLKEVNGSLYSVMRLAHPSLNNQTLHLEFRFPFHQKRAAEAKNIALMVRILKQHMEIDVVVETNINAELSPQKNQPKSVSNPAHASLIASVQDIMGGGEVVNA